MKQFSGGDYNTTISILFAQCCLVVIALVAVVVFVFVFVVVVAVVVVCTSCQYCSF